MFRESAGSARYPRQKAQAWREDPSYELRNLIVAVDENGAIAGLVRLVPRMMQRGGQRLRAFGLSSVCVRPDLRGSGLAAALIEKSVRVARERGADLAFLVARRAADHFYTRFGFHGVAAYNRVLLRVGDLERATPARISLRSTTEHDLPALSEARRKCFRSTFGAQERDARLWRFLLRRFSAPSDVRWHTLKRGDRPVAYALMDASVVHELAWRSDEDVPTILRALARRLGNPPQLEFRLPGTHALIAHLQTMDATLVHRQCVYGGHMVRVLNPERLGKLLALRITRRARALAVRAYHETSDGIAVSYRDARSEIRFTGVDIRNPLGFRTTCSLLGLKAPSVPVFRLDDPLPFNLGLADEV